MRLSGLSLAAILLFSLNALAQRSTTPSAPPPAPAPSPVVSSPPPAPVHVSTPSTPVSTPSPSPSVSHTSVTPSSPSPVPVSHVAPSPSPSSGHASAPAPTEPSKSAPVARAPEPDARRVVTDERLSGAERIVPARRIGENPPEQAPAPKPAEPDLRRRVCENPPCKETPEPRVDPDLRRRICVNGSCGCPAGQTATKDGCVTTVVNPVNTCEPGRSWNGASCANICPANQSWNGISCAPYGQCQPNQTWNGSNCVTSTECAGVEGGAASLIMELRSLRAEIQQACSQSSSAQRCTDLKMQQSGTLARYRMLWSGAPVACRTGLPDPASLM